MEYIGVQKTVNTFCIELMQKRKYIRSDKITKAAEGEKCTINSPACNYDPETTVFAHSNEAEDGKGMGIKAEDIYGAFACSDCHTWIDGTTVKDWEARETKQWFMDRGIKRTMKRLFELGVYKIVD